MSNLVSPHQRLMRLLILSLITFGPWAPAAEFLTVNSCEALLGTPDKWSPGAVDRAVEVIKWMTRVHPEFQSGLQDAGTQNEFAALYFAAVGHMMPPRKKLLLNELLENPLGGLYNAAVPRSRAKSRAAQRLTRSLVHRNLSDGDKYQYLLTIVGAVRDLANTLRANGGNPPTGAMQYLLTPEVLVRHEISAEFEDILHSFVPILDPLNDPAVFALVYEFLKSKGGLMADCREELDAAFNNSFSLTSLKKCALQENTAQIHRYLNEFRPSERGRSVIGAEPAVTLVSGPVVPPPDPPPTPSRDTTAMKDYFNASERWAHRGGRRLEFADAMQLDRELERAQFYVNDIQGHALTLLGEELPWTKMHEIYGRDHDPRAIARLIETLGLRNTAAMLNVSDEYRAMMFIATWFGQQQTAFANLDKSGATVAQFDHLTQRTLDLVMTRFELLTNSVQTAITAFEMRLTRMSEESAALANLSAVVATRLQVLLAGTKPDESADALIEALAELAQHQPPPPPAHVD